MLRQKGTRRQILIVLCLTTIASCAIEPSPNPWTEFERIPEEATFPVLPPELASDLSNLDVVLDVQLENYDIAEANAEALISRKRAYNNLLDAAKIERQRSEAFREMLEQERKARLWDKISTWSIIGILGILSVD